MGHRGREAPALSLMVLLERVLATVSAGTVSAAWVHAERGLRERCAISLNPLLWLKARSCPAAQGERARYGGPRFEGLGPRR